jgi:regulatory protein
VIITKITATKAEWLVKFDNEESLTLYENTILKYRLVVGKEIDDEFLKQIQHYDLVEVNYLKLLRSLKSYKTEAEVKQKLTVLTLDEDQQEIIIQRLIDLKMINDEEYIKYFLTKDYSSMKLRYTLKQKGFKNSLIETILSKYDETQALDNIYQQVKKRYLNKADGVIKLKKYLLGLGFSYSLINEIVNAGL